MRQLCTYLAQKRVRQLRRRVTSANRICYLATFPNSLLLHYQRPNNPVSLLRCWSQHDCMFIHRAASHVLTQIHLDHACIFKAALFIQSVTFRRSFQEARYVQFVCLGGAPGNEQCASSSLRMCWMSRQCFKDCLSQDRVCGPCLFAGRALA